MRSREWGTHPLTLAWRAATVVYEDLFPFVGMSLLVWASIVAIIPAFPALVALHEMARLALEGYGVSVQRWWAAMREYFFRAWRVGLLTLGVGAVLVANVLFYGRQGQSPWHYVSVFWLWLSILWGLSTLYLAPLTVLQEEPRAWRLARNALYLTLARPFHTLVAAGIVLFTGVLSLVFPVLLLAWPAYVAVYTTLLARQLILAIQRRAQ